MKKTNFNIDMQYLIEHNLKTHFELSEKGMWKGKYGEATLKMAAESIVYLINLRDENTQE